MRGTEDREKSVGSKIIPAQLITKGRGWGARVFINLRPEMGNIFLFINVQDFLDSMVIHILGTKRIYTK